MAGAGGQITMIVPSHDLVVARLGHYKGEAAGTAAVRKALALLMEAVPGQEPKNSNSFALAAIRRPVSKCRHRYLRHRSSLGAASVLASRPERQFE